jgi:endonuclease/exonuclease/phosphatase family metal-dependent hydrolase
MVIRVKSVTHVHARRRSGGWLPLGRTARRQPNGQARVVPGSAVEHKGPVRNLVRLAAVTVLAALLTATGVVGGPAPFRPSSAASIPSTATYTIWHWNVAGSAMHAGSTTDGMVLAAVSSILARGAGLASFNELCWQQYRAVQAELSKAGWPQDSTNFSRFQTTQTGSATLCGGMSYGNAVFSKAPLASVDQIVLPDDGSPQHRGLMCAQLRNTPTVRFCTTHITTSSAISPLNGRSNDVNQLNAVLAQLERYHAQGVTALLAGDLNSHPYYRRLDAWYSSAVHTAANGSNTGQYRELDDADATHCPGYGEWTATGTPGVAPPCGQAAGGCVPSTGAGCSKIDFIFVRQDRIVGRYSADSLATSTSCPAIAAKPGVYPAGSCSDHRILTGVVTVRTG